MRFDYFRMSMCTEMCGGSSGVCVGVFECVYVSLLFWIFTPGSRVSACLESVIAPGPFLSMRKATLLAVNWLGSRGLISLLDV